MSVHERECCLTLDEMSITAGAEFDTRTGRFIGDVTLPDHSGIATHSLVFMLGGITTRWKQTVAYYFTGNSTDGSVFAPIVLSIIKHCYDIGLNAIYSVCILSALMNKTLNKFGDYDCNFAVHSSCID